MIERTFQRFPASLPGTLLAGDEEHVIRSVDLSRNGCRIQITVSLVPGMTVDLVLFPGGHEPIALKTAKVRWSGAEGIGIEFQEIPFEHLHRLDLLINQLKKPH